MADEITVPGTKKRIPKWAAAVGLGGVAVLIYLYYRNKSSASSAASSTTAAGTGLPGYGANTSSNGSDPYPWDGTYNNPSDPYSMDSSTGITYGDENAGIGGSGYPYGGGGAGGGGAGGTSGGPPFSTNAQWSAYVIPALEANDANLDPGTVADAIGEFINGQPVTAPGKNIVFDAIAIGGDPPVAGPNGYPPAVHSTGTSTGGTPPPAGGTKVTIPNGLVGKRVELEVIPQLTGLGLKVHTNPTVNPAHEYVLDSYTPGGGTRVDQGSTVDLGIHQIS